MKLLVFGSTGGTGRELVRQALENGHAVTAFARAPAKIDDLRHDQLMIAKGDVRDPEAVANAIPGHDAVLSAIGAGAKPSTLREDGTRVIVEAMEQASVKRLISQSSLGIGDSRGNLDVITKFLVVPLYLRHAFKDHERQEAVIRKSSLDWILVRPPHLKDGPRTGEYRHGFPATDRSIKGVISRADVADFMLKQLADDTYLQKSPGISY